MFASIFHFISYFLFHFFPSLCIVCLLASLSSYFQSPSCKTGTEVKSQGNHSVMSFLSRIVSSGDKFNTLYGFVSSMF